MKNDLKYCRVCGDTENLFFDSLGRCKNVCLRCREEHGNPTIKKAQETMRKRYGVPHALQSKEIQDKIKAPNWMTFLKIPKAA